MSSNLSTVACVSAWPSLRWSGLINVLPVLPPRTKTKTAAPCKKRRAVFAHHSLHTSDVNVIAGAIIVYLLPDVQVKPWIAEGWMSNLVHNERVKLFATFVNNIGVVSCAAGAIVPLFAEAALLTPSRITISIGMGLFGLFCMGSAQYHLGTLKE